MTHPSAHFRPNIRRRGFTLVELLAVIGIIILLVGMTIPAIKSLSKSNDQSQAVNLVSSMISSARSTAISQHRPAGVVFFEETSQYSSPVNGGQTAMQIFVENYDQTNTNSPIGLTEFIYYSARQYLPAGVRLAALSDLATTNNNVETGDVGAAADATNARARAILFDANGQLLLRHGLATSPVGGSQKGVYSSLGYGDWHFASRTATSLNPDAYSSPGFFLYSTNEYNALPQNAAIRAAWLRKNATVIIVNGNTGGILR